MMSVPEVTPTSSLLGKLATVRPRPTVSGARFQLKLDINTKFITHGKERFVSMSRRYLNGRLLKVQRCNSEPTHSVRVRVRKI